MECRDIAWDLPTLCYLLKMSFFSIINESSFPVAIFVELALIASILSRDNLAAYAAISSTLTFTLNIFNFLVTVTMAQVSKAVGGKLWSKVGSKLLVALTTGLGVGIVCAVLLFSIRDHVFQFMGLTVHVRQLASTPYAVRLISLPFMMMQRVCVGTLGGYQRLKTMAILAVTTSILEICSQVYALHFLDGGLLYATIGRVVVSIVGCGLALCCVLAFPPAEAGGSIKLVSCFSKKESNASTMLSATLFEDKNMVKTKGCIQHICEYASASGDVTIRSLLLTGSVYAMSIIAGNLGTPAFAAHQIGITLWMVTSYVCDGFADVGTIFGGEILGSSDPDKYNRALILRDILILFGLSMGIVAGAGMFLFRDAVLDLFAVESKKATFVMIKSIWPILCAMQVINATVFVLDGLIYAAHAFRFVRNLMIIACIFVFAPLVIVVTSVSYFHSLFYIWVAKTALNSVRALGAVWLWYVKLPADWKETV